MYIFFRAKGKNRDTWHVVQVLSTDFVYNQVTVGDLAYLFIGESNWGQIGGIGKRTQRDTTGHNFRTVCSESTELHQMQYRAPTQKKGV